ncbi:serine/threonine-protein kinase [Streptomyces sp. NPDC051211]|uniref:serine/threonine-protein kinase n=1 Tax=Streptomyces sp. NPDC051211 TaxID=3154643 RepID=UPI00344EFD35
MAMEHLHPGDPHRIGPYRLLSRLGAGGMGQVYLARSDRGRTVAVKLVHPELARREEFRTRFRQEVSAARRVGGGWTAPVLDADTEADTPWLATGYVAGPSLRQVVARDFGPLPTRSVRILAAGLAHALQDIHRAGLIHRDLKPSNVLLTIDGPRVIDFGIARALEDTGTVTAGLTRTGELVGSPGFMAPEQILGEPVTPACDVFCLGAVLMYAATGALPFGDPEGAGGLAPLLLRITEAEPDLTAVPAELRELVAGCLKKEPAGRPTPAELLSLVGAGDTVADGKALEPWLPGALVAQLGRHAVQLLDREDTGPDHPGPDHRPRPDHHLPQADHHPQPDHHHPRPDHHPQPDHHHPRPDHRPLPDPPTLAAPVPAYPSYGPAPGYGPAPATVPVFSYPPPPPHAAAPVPAQRPRPAGTAFLVAVATVVAIAAGGTVYAVMSAGDGQAPGASPRTGTGPATGTSTAAPTAPTGAATGSPGSPVAGGGATPAATPAPGTGGIPAGYLGTWTATSGSQSWQLTVTQGAVGDRVMSLAVRSPTLDCGWSATLQSAGPPVELSPSTVTYGPPASCNPGQWSRLTLQGDGTLVRELVGGQNPPLTYHR